MAAARYVVREDKTGAGGPELRGAARELWGYKGPEAMVAGPAETGKTFACLYRLHCLLIRYPGAQAVMVRKVRDTIQSTCLQTYTKKILRPDGRGGYVGVKAYGGEKPQWFDYPKKSRLWLAGLDDAGKALSSERDFIFANQSEELSEDDWGVLTTRATGRAGNAPYGQVFGDCNPGPAHHWIRHRPSLKVLESRHEDNPALWDADKREWTEQGRRTIAVLDALPGVRKERLRYGRWVSAEGAVFPFDARRHRVTRAWLTARGLLAADGRPGPAAKRVLAGVDWGFTAPGVLAVWFVDGDGRMYLAREWYMTGRLIGWWVGRGREAKRDYGVTRFVCDPAEPAYIEEFNRAGLSAVAGDNDRAPGIQVTQARFDGARDERPRIYFCEGALAEADPDLLERKQPVCTEQEMESLTWAPGRNGKPAKEGDTVGADHGADACRYVCMSLHGAATSDPRAGLPAPHQRTLVPMPDWCRR